MIPAPSILIVEDDPRTSELIDRFLSKEVFRTSRAADGRTAIDTFAAVGPDLVILDVMLPKVEGFEVCAVIRPTSKVPILFLLASQV
jgi:DNA-binding response OmpR family regulator